MAKAKRDIEAEVTQRIIEVLEKGAAPWVKPWIGGETAPTNPISGTRYRGINIILLIMAGFAGGYESNRWVTFNQVRDVAMKAMARDLGKAVMAEAPEPEGKRTKAILASWMRKRLEEQEIDPDAYPHVCKGQKGHQVVFQKVMEYDCKDENGNLVTDEDGNILKRPVFVRKGYTVFNLEQVENVPEDLKGPITEVPDEPLFELDDKLEQALADALPELVWRVGGARACYSPALDAINMPEHRRFSDAGAWYATKLHESVHATGHRSRLDRFPAELPQFGSPAYAKEELTAEIGSAFLCAHLGIDGFLQHPEYVNNWIQVLNADKREVFRAASRAQKACNFILKGMGLLESEDVDVATA